MIISCVIMIAYGGAKTQSGDTDMKSLMLAIGFALCTGLVFSLNTVDINYILQTVKFPGA